MRKELQLILASALFVSGCAPVVAKAQGPDVLPTDTPNVFYDPTLTPVYTPTPDYSFLFATPTATNTPEPTQTPLPTEIVNPKAESCVLPFDGAQMTGLQFKSVIKNNGLPVTEPDGTIHRHLGLDFEGGKEGDPIANMCDGELVFAGAVKEGYGMNLGNVVVMKYTYTENGVEKNVYMRYAHMENVTTLPIGTKIPKGQKIGELGHSGGWGPDHAHLHVDLWKEEAWKRIIVDRSGGDLRNEVGYYALGEIWSENTFNQNLIDPRKWLQERLYK